MTWALAAVQEKNLEHEDAVRNVCADHSNPPKPQEKKEEIQTRVKYHQLGWYNQQLYQVLALNCKGEALAMIKALAAGDFEATRGVTAWYRLSRDHTHTSPPPLPPPPSPPLSPPPSPPLPSPPTHPPTHPPIVTVQITWVQQQVLGFSAFWVACACCFSYLLASWSPSLMPRDEWTEVVRRRQRREQRYERMERDPARKERRAGWQCAVCSSRNWTTWNWRGKNVKLSSEIT